MGIDRDQFIRSVRARAAFENDAQAIRAIEATLGVLGMRLFENDARVIADQLPLAWASLMRREGDEDPFDLDELYRRVAAREGVQLGHGMEHAQVVCQVLAEQVDDGGRRHLRLRLPPALAELFTEREPPPAPPRRVGATPVSHAPPRATLAGGRAGSARPLSEARHPDGQANSIAVGGDPHAGTKLSSARGLSAQREHEDLASARPKEGRTLATRKE